MPPPDVDVVVESCLVKVHPRALACSPNAAKSWEMRERDQYIGQVKYFPGPTYLLEYFPPEEDGDEDMEWVGDSLKDVLDQFSKWYSSLRKQDIRIEVGPREGGLS